MAAKSTAALKELEKPKPLEVIEPESKADAKKRKKDENKQDKEAAKRDKRNKKASKKGKSVIIAVILVIAVVAIIAGIALNVFNIRDNYFSGIINNIPIVNNLIGDTTSTDDPYAEYTKDQLIQQIKTLQTQVENKDEEIAALNDKVTMYVNELEPLKNIEEQHVQFNLDKAAFDEAVALGDTTAYQRFFEQIEPERAAELYKEVVAINNRTKEFRKYVETYTEMAPGKAAEAFEVLLPTDMDLVVDILNAMESAVRAEIMAEMTAQNNAAVTKQLRPSE